MNAAELQYCKPVSFAPYLESPPQDIYLKIFMYQDRCKSVAKIMSVIESYINHRRDIDFTFGDFYQNKVGPQHP